VGVDITVPRTRRVEFRCVSLLIWDPKEGRSRGETGGRGGRMGGRGDRRRRGTGGEAVV